MTHIEEIMAYISDFGTKCVAPILGLVALTGAASAYSATSADVTVQIDNLRNDNGQLMVCLTDNPKAFPDCKKDASSLKKLMPASSHTLTFAGVSPGTYAVAVVHDENRNNKLDTRLFVPKEGFAFSRNPAIRMGPPKFESAAFAVGRSRSVQKLRMKYIF